MSIKIHRSFCIYGGDFTENKKQMGYTSRLWKKKGAGLSVMLEAA